MPENWPLSVRQEATDPGSSENNKQDKCPNPLHLGIYRKSMIKKNSWKKPEEENTLPIEEQR